MKQLFKNFNLPVMPVLLILLTTTVLTISCSKSNLKYEFNTEPGYGGNPPAVYPDVNFTVLSDLHIYDISLGIEGAAFEQVLQADRKLLLDSMDLLDYAIDNIIYLNETLQYISTQGINFVLVSGDLTKDGELINHQGTAERLKRLVNAGINVFVVPGNHDVNCPDAVMFIDDKTIPVPAATEKDFAEIHNDFGYGTAIYKDTDSLSYVAEPVEGLWLLALDSTRWKENEPGKKAVISGSFSQKTIDWMTTVLREAAGSGKAVIAMMHHGAVEHWKGQAKLHPDYVINDYKNFSKFLASWNVKVIFTGHYHANDITRADFNGKSLYDIETGSLVTAPSPVRNIQIKNNEMIVSTNIIIDRMYPDTDFADNARSFVKKTVMLETADILRRFRVSEKDIGIIADAVGDAFTAHYNGNEDPALRTEPDKSKLGLWGRIVLWNQQYVLDGLWKDLPPEDNDTTIKLSN